MPSNGDGDGLVNIQGLNCEILKRGVGDKPIVTMQFKNHNHNSLLYSPDVLQRIADIIIEENKTAQ